MGPLIKELTCDFCQLTFAVTRSKWKNCRRHKKDGVQIFCSKSCSALGKKSANPPRETPCANCGKWVTRKPSEIKRVKNCFCNNSCRAVYNNLHKTYGSSRSKLEMWLESQLSQLFPNLKILYNTKNAENFELDIFVPSLKFAIELNGILHYKPIYGEKKFAIIQKRDAERLISCRNEGIILHILDVSEQHHMTPKNSQKYLDQICLLIHQQL